MPPRLLALLLVALLALLAAEPALAGPLDGSNGERVDLRVTSFPAEALVGKAHPVAFNLTNRLESRETATVRAALFDPGASDKRCDVPGPGFRGFFAKQVAETVESKATKSHPATGSRYAAAEGFHIRVDPGMASRDGVYEVCVWAEDAYEQGDFFDVEVLPLRVRLRNEPPEASFSWSPATGTTGTAFRFEAAASDADGDNLTYAWDFGRLTVEGAARAEGPVVTHRFYPAGTYNVTLTVSDGFDATTVTLPVQVSPAPTGVPVEVATPKGGAPVPGSSAPAALAAFGGALILGALARRRA